MKNKQTTIVAILVIIIIFLTCFVIYQRYQHKQFLQKTLYSLIYYKANHLASMKELIQEGADVNAIQGSLPPPISASAGQSYEISKLLLENGANVNQVYSENLKMPLYYAVCSGDIRMVKLFNKYGGKFNDIKSPEMDTAFEFASACGYQDIVEFLSKLYAINNHEYNNAINPASESKYSECINTIKYLIANPPCNITKGINGGILKAQDSGNTEIAKILKKKKLQTFCPSPKAPKGQKPHPRDD